MALQRVHGDGGDSGACASKLKDVPNCALQLSMVLSRLSWNLLRICRLGEMSGTGAVCCWTDSLSSFRSISALLRSGRQGHTLVRRALGGGTGHAILSFPPADTRSRTRRGEKPPTFSLFVPTASSARRRADVDRTAPEHIWQIYPVYSTVVWVAFNI